MKNQTTSKIATIIYGKYTENIDMNNAAFKQSELNNLIKNDKDIIRVDYYINGVMVGNKFHTPMQAANQIKRLDVSQYKIGEKMRKEYGPDWYANVMYNQTRQREIAEIQTKINNYIPFLTKDAYDNVLALDMCCDYEDFIG